LDASKLKDGNVVLNADHLNIDELAAPRATVTLTKDSVAPKVTATSTTATINNANVRAYRISGTCSESGKPIELTGDFKGGTTSCVNGKYALALDLRDAPDGPVPITAKHIDDAGNPATPAVYTANKFVQIPTITLDDNGAINGTNVTAYQVSGKCSENGRSVNIGGTVVRSTICLGGFYSLTINYTGVVDGPVLVTVNHTGADGSTAIPIEKTISKDTSRPVVLFTSMTPITAAKVAAFVVRGMCSEAGQKVLIDGSVKAEGLCDGAAFAISADYRPISDGNVSITADLTDAAGNKATKATISLVKDTVLPTVTLDNRGFLNTENAAHYFVSGTCSENNRQVIIGGTLAKSTTCVNNTFRVEMDYSAIPDGEVRITIDQTDAAGNPALQASSTLSKESLIPTVTLTNTGPVRLDNVVAYPIEGTCSEPGQTVELNGGITATTVCQADKTFSKVVNYSNLPDTTYTLRATFVSSSGNPAVPATLSVVKDTVRPTLAITNTNSINASTALSFAVIGTCSDSQRPVNITATDGTRETTASSTCANGSFSVPTNFGSLVDGPITVSANMTDTVGNPALMSQVTITRDTVLPTARITSSGYINADSVSSYTVRGTCSETGRLVTIAGRVGGSTTCSSGAFAAALNYSQADDGPVTVTAMMSDAAGNISTTSTVTLIKDTVPATVAINNSTPVNASNEAAYPITGTCSEPTRNVTIDGGVGEKRISGVTTCSGSGTFTLTRDLTEFDQGSITITATQTDAAGNTRPPVSATLTKNTERPQVTLDNFDFIKTSNAASFTISGSCSENNRQVTLSGSIPTSTTTCTSGRFAMILDLRGVNDGAVTIAASQTSAAGSPSLPVSSILTKDTWPPTVRITNTNAVNSTNANAFEVTGTCTETGQDVVLSGSNSATTTCVLGTFTASLNYLLLPDGPITITANHRDAAGNSASPQTATLNKDTVVPTVSISPPGYVNAANAGGFIVRGTCSDDNRLVNLGGSVTRSVNCSSGTYATSLDLSSFPDGLIPITADHADLAGNNASTVAINISKVTSNPTVSITSSGYINASSVNAYHVIGTCSENSQAVNISGSISGSTICTAGIFDLTLNMSGLPDGAVTLTAAHMSASFNQAPQSTVTLTKDTVAPTIVITSSTPISKQNVSSYTVSGTCSDSNRAITLGGAVSGVASCTGSSFTASLNYASVPDGSVTLTAGMTDAAGNAAMVSTVSLVKDTVSPTVAITSTTAVNRNNRASYAVTGTCSEDGRTISITGTSIAQAICTSGAFSTSVDLSGVSDGTLTFNADLTDAVSNSAVTATASITKDTVQPTITLTTSGPISTLNVASYRISGTCSENSRNIDISGAVTGTAVCTAGVFSTNLNFTTVLDGDVTITANQTDLAGNTSTAVSATVAKITSRPTVTMTDTGPINISNVSSYTISGSCSENDRDLNISGTVSAVATCANGSYAVSINLSSIPDGTITFIANLVDAAGNQATPASRSFTKDTSPPTVGLTSTTPINSYNVSTYALTGTCSEANRQVSFSGGASGSVSCSAGGTFTFTTTFASVSDGPINILATQSDAVGNSTTSTPLTLIKDTVAPTVTVDAGGPIYNQNHRAYKVSGTCTESGRSVEISGSLSQSTTCTAGRYSETLDYSSVSDGTVTISATQSDANGNLSATASRSVTKNTRTPTISFNAVPTINIQNAASYSLSGTCSENGQNVTLSGTVSDQVPCVGNLFSKSFDLRSVPDSTQLVITAGHASIEGNLALPYTLNLVKDTTPPQVSLKIGGIVNANNQNSFVVSGSCTEDSQPVLVRAFVASGTPAAVQASPTCSSGAFAVSLNLSAYADGALTIQADQSDASGNAATQAETILQKETSAATVSVNPVEPVNSSNVAAYILSGNCSENGSAVMIHGDLPAVANCSGGTFQYIYNLSGMADGTLNATVSHGTLARTATSVSISIPKDVVRPSVTIANSGYIAKGQDQPYTISGSCSENGRQVVISGTSNATATCTSGSYTASLNLGGIADGTVTIQADLTDAAGNTAITAAVNITKITVDPVVTITNTTVINSVNAAAYLVTGTCSATSSPVQIGGTLSGSGTCGLEGNFSIPINYSSKPDGSIIITASQSDDAGNVSNTASVTLQKNTVIPTLVLDSLTTINQSNVTSVVISGSCSANGSEVMLTGSFNGGAVCASGRFTVVKDVTLIADGQLTITANVSDIYGNPAVPVTLTPTKDTVSPTVALGVSGWVNSTSVRIYNIVGSCSDNGRTVSISGAVSGSAICTGGVFSLVRDFSGVTDGPVTIIASTTDAYGNPSSVASATLIKDTMAPTLTFTSTAAVNIVNNAAYRVTGTCSEHNRFVTISGTVPGSTSCLRGSFAANLNFSQFDDGPISIGVTQTDAAGNTSPVVTQNLTKDTGSPTVSINALSAINGATVAAYTVSGTCSENGRSVALSGSLSASPTCTNGTYSANLNYSSVADGTVTIVANLTDAAGNPAESKSRTIFKDVVAPTVTISNSGFITSATASAYAITGTCSDNDRPITITGTLTSSTTCASQTYTALVDASAVADGPITIRAVTSDASGNLSTMATASVTKETIAPIPGGGGAVLLSSVRETMLVVSWAPASDNLTARENLLYQVIYSTSPDIQSVATALANGTAASSPLRNTTTFEIANLSPDTRYYVTVLVTDSAGNAAAYVVASTTTAPSLVLNSGVDMSRSSQPRSFYDTVGGRHWVFTGRSDQIEYRYGMGSNAWASAGNLSYANAQFAVAYRVLNGVAYVFLVTTSSHNIVLRRGTVSGATITFGQEQPIFTGTSASNSYIRPTIALDSNDKIWVGAVQRQVQATGITYTVSARRSDAAAGGDLTSWSSPNSWNDFSGSIEDLILVSLGQENMGLVVNASQLFTYRYNGTSWSSSVGSGAASWLTFPGSTITGEVQAMVVKNSYLYAAGSFSQAGGVPGTSGIARWNGTYWEPLGAGIDGVVRALAVDDNGTVYAGGSFTSAGGISGTAYLARWNQAGWQPVGSGVNGTVYALALDQSGRLYVGGRFTAAGGIANTRNIARWSGTAWAALGQGTDGDVLSIAVANDGVVFVGGAFNFAGGVGSTSSIARWNGSTWSGLSTGITGRVTSLAVQSSTLLYAGGVFTSAGGAAITGVAKWDGSSWGPLGTGVTYNDSTAGTSVDALAIDTNGTLYAGGVFTKAGSATGTSSIARWNGSAWEALGSGVVGAVSAIAVNASGDIFAGGAFTSASGVANTAYVARFFSNTWRSLGIGIDQSINAIVADGNGHVYVGGNFTNAGGVANTKYIARWTGTAWQAVGSGMAGPVRALLLVPSGLIAAGDFSSASSVTDTRYIAQWNGSAWVAMGSGFNASAAALAMDSSGAIYAGGDFTASGSTPLNRIAKWVGNSWSPLGTGMDGSVLALATDTNGNLYAGGSFSQAGGISGTAHIARWNGSAWSALGSGLNSTVYALAVSSTGILYAGGAFTASGGTSLSRIGRWNGSSWSPLGSGLGQWVYSLLIDGSGHIYAGSDPTIGTGGRYTGGVAKWADNNWQVIGTGINSAVSALAVSTIGSASRLFVGGGFTMAGGWPSNFLAAWPLNSYVGLTQGGARGLAAIGDPLTSNIYVLKTHIDGASRLANESGTWSSPVALSSPSGLNVQFNYPVMALDNSVNKIWAFWSQNGSIWQTVATGGAWGSVSANEITAGLKPYGLGVAPIPTQGQVRLTVGDVSSGSTRLMIFTTR
jgi:hypothetical protein